MRVGISVTCAICGLTKKPIGRSASDVTASGYCDSDCEGYYKHPMPGSLWPGETEVEFGYPCGSNATEEIPKT